MAVTYETITIQKQIVTISIHASESLKHKGLLLLLGLIPVMAVAIWLHVNEFELAEKVGTVSPNFFSILAGIILITYMWWANRIARRQKEKAMRVFGWDGTHPVEMRVDYQSFLHD